MLSLNMGNHLTYFLCNPVKSAAFASYITVNVGCKMMYVDMCSYISPSTEHKTFNIHHNHSKRGGGSNTPIP